MITLQKQKFRPREFRGPAPGSVAILGRQPGHRGAEKIIDDMKKELDYRKDCKEQAKDIKDATIRGYWERNVNKKMILASTFREFTKAKSELQDSIENRRERLLQLIAEEHNDLEQEMGSTYETIIERQAKLREKAKQLKDEKAQDLEMTAKMKYDQLWRDQCEELRTVLSKKTAIEVAQDNLEQLKLKDLISNEKKNEEMYFAQLWMEDIKKKEDRENRDAEKAAERNRNMSNILREQNSVIEDKRRQDKELKNEEIRLRLEMLELKKLEVENEYDEKLKKQQRTKEIYDTNLRQKMKRHNREMQEEIALDSKLLEKLLADSEGVANLHIEKKRKMMEDSKRYREYLKMLKDQEIVREKELEEMMNEEIQKQWQKRLDQWDREKETRKKLLYEVIRIRQQQVEDKLHQNEENQRENRMYREAFAKLIENNKIEDETKKMMLREKDQSYGDDLLQQIRFNENQTMQKELEKQMEKESMWQTEEMFKKKIADTLDEDWVDPHAHPWRKYSQQSSSLK